MQVRLAWVLKILMRHLTSHINFIIGLVILYLENNTVPSIPRSSYAVEPWYAAVGRSHQVRKCRQVSPSVLPSRGVGDELHHAWLLPHVVRTIVQKPLRTKRIQVVTLMHIII